MDPPTLIELGRTPWLPLLFARAAINVRARRMPAADPPSRALPARGLRRPGISVHAERVSEYSRLCGFPVRDQLPPTYPHLLAFPLQMAYLADPSFPLPLPGLVHIHNEITALVPVPPDATVDLEVWGTDLRTHRSGTAVDIHSRTLLAGRPAWHGRSTYLARRRRSHNSAAQRDAPASPAPNAARSGDSVVDWGDTADSADSADTAPRHAPAATWTLRGDVGRRYAAVSGDLNPIHLHPATARLFGLRAPIAHGMYTHARSVAAMMPRLPERVRLRAQFRAPISVPQQVDLYLRRSEDLILAELTSRGADHVLLSTTASPLADA